MENKLLIFDKEKMTGRRKVQINLTLKQFLENPFDSFVKNIGTINSIRKVNNDEIEYLIKYKKGLSSILEKARIDGANNNNISIVNFAYEIVEFKKGFTVGKPIQYVNISEEKNDDMKYFLKFLKKNNKKSKDITKYENIYTYGIAHTFVKMNENYENTKVPFTYDVIDSTKTCCVYSNDITTTKLFSMYESVIKDSQGNEQTAYTIYFQNKSMIVVTDRSSNTGYSLYQGIKTEPFNDPITEYELNQSRMGVFEPVLNSLNNLNFVRSNQLDDIQDFINAYLIFLNVDKKYIQAQKDVIKKNKMIAITSNNTERPADIKMLKQSLEHKEINELFNDMKQDVFNQVGVPMATSNTGQGVSGEAQTYGGGWENAQTYANIETTYISQFEREDLTKVIDICNSHYSNVINELDESDIDIKYTINKSNNILTKMQSFKYWIDLGGSFERGLELCDLSEDTHTIGVESENHKLEQERLKMELEIEKAKKLKELESSNEDVNG